MLFAVFVQHLISAMQNCIVARRESMSEQTDLSVPVTIFYSVKRRNCIMQTTVFFSAGLFKSQKNTGIAKARQPGGSSAGS